jgi:hypothetical protein
VPTLRSGIVWQIWHFAMFLSILLPLSRNLTPSLSYHIVRKRIAKVTDFLSFCPFGIRIFPFLTIGISMYQKRILPYFIIPSTFSPQASSPLERYRQRKFYTPCYLSSFFPTERAGPYPQAQLYWAGQTMGWMADWTRTALRWSSGPWTLRWNYV